METADVKLEPPSVIFVPNVPALLHVHPADQSAGPFKATKPHYFFGSEQWQPKQASRTVCNKASI